MKGKFLENNRTAERGSANIRLLIFLAVLIVAANAGYNYIPTAYQGESFKQDMQTAVIQTAALPSAAGNTPEALKTKLVKLATQDQLPPALIDVRQINNVVAARVKYTKEVSIVPFGIYNYHYEFDHTATPSGFLLKDN